jgi:DNA (cytosine-5)-methyltransferase 1
VAGRRRRTSIVRALRPGEPVYTLPGSFHPRWSPPSDLTARDDFAGQGGESSGLEQAGFTVRHATNHNPLAVGVHQENHQQTGHTCGDLRRLPYRHFPHADLYWASPECKNYSPARGGRPPSAQPDLWGERLADIEEEQSRLLMEEVVRYVRDEKELRGKPFKYFEVENVVEVKDWIHFDRWCKEMRDLDYHLDFVSLNAMFAHGREYLAPGQSRDRLYISGTHRGQPRPDFDIRPPAWCPNCAAVVDAVQVWRRPRGRIGKYRQQYDYRCPTIRCGQLVEPLAMAALPYLNLEMEGVAIEERADHGLRPLQPATEARIRAGLARYVLPLLLEGALDGAEPPWTPPLLVPLDGRDGKNAKAAYQPSNTQTQRAETYFAQPVIDPTQPLMFEAKLRGGGERGRAHPLHEPIGALTAFGNHDLLVNAGVLIRNNTEHGSPGHMSTPLLEYARTLTARNPHLLATPPPLTLLMSYYRTGGTQPIDRPAPTLTTVDRHALIRLQWEHLQAMREVIKRHNFRPEDVPEELFRKCRVRMVEPDEGGALMGFESGRKIMGNRREQMALHGLAVVPAAARLIGDRITWAQYPEVCPSDARPTLAALSSIGVDIAA